MGYRSLAISAAAVACLGGACGKTYDEAPALGETSGGHTHATDPGMAGEAGAGGTREPTASAEGGAGGTPSEDDAGNTSVAGGGGEAETPDCGDGVVEWPEQCDPPGVDGCTGACLIPHCGSGPSNPISPCDDANLDPHDDCKNDCTEAYCGDGVVRSESTIAEDCDSGEENGDASCTDDCKLPPRTEPEPCLQQQVQPLGFSERPVRAFAVDATHLYYSDSERIWVQRLDRELPEEESIPADSPRALAVTGTHLYWTQSGDPPGVFRASLETHYVQRLRETASSGLAVSDEAVFTASSGALPTVIERFDLADRSAVTLRTLSPEQEERVPKLLLDAGLLYFFQITLRPARGHGIDVAASTLVLDFPAGETYDFALDADRLYWLEQMQNFPPEFTLRSRPRTSGDNVTLARFEGSPLGLAVTERSIFIALHYDDDPAASFGRMVRMDKETLEACVVVSTPGTDRSLTVANESLYWIGSYTTSDFGISRIAAP